MTGLFHSPRAADRLARARAWLLEVDASGATELLVVASSDAARDLLRESARERGAAFGWHRASIARLAASLAGPALCENELVPIGRLAAEAVVTRVVAELARRGGLGRYEGVRDGPGLPRAVARTLEELRLARAHPRAIAAIAKELAALLESYDAALARAGLADRARVLALAEEAARNHSFRHPLLGLPTLLLDVALPSAAERELVAAVLARAPDVLATLPAGDVRTLAQLRAIGLEPDAHAPAGAAASALASLQTHLFEKSAPTEPPQDGGLEILSAPGESRECVEIARRCLRLASEGVPFDRIAILLRSPEEYRPHLEEALGRAGIPAYFAAGVVRPDPAGRAFLALLACAAEALSARRFAEYLSLGEVPDATDAGAPPPVPAERWVAPDAELVAEAVAEALAAAAAASAVDADAAAADTSAERVLAADPEAVAVTAGRLRAPWRWEELLVEAAVIGGRERWERRLVGLRHELEQDLASQGDPEGATAQRIRRDLADLEALRGFALPLLADLEALPSEASWAVWLDRLSALAGRALRHPQRVHSVLAELAPMAEVGPVGLAEVQAVLGERLLELALPPPRSRYGRVFVAPCDAARGMAFAAVFVPGLAEKLFPKQIAEDPILLDAQRRELAHASEARSEAKPSEAHRASEARSEAKPSEDHRDRLVTNEDRVAHERFALRLAAGAATGRLLLSWPRLDLEKSRPRVASFYALEALRAGEGLLPGFDALGERAERATEARVGWPAPEQPEDAIDEAEHDLALLRRIFELDPARSAGTANYLLGANPHLGRALRFRARRWLSRWTGADGLVRPGEGAREAIADTALAAIASHALPARSYSPTALQTFAACPYRFLLHAVHRIAPREVPEAIDEMDPLQRGSLVHDVQFELFAALEREGLLPVAPATLPRAREILDQALDRVAARHHDELAPAIERVWADGVAGVRADLREWLRRASEDDSGFVPWRFELAFGLAERRPRDPHSTSEPVALECGLRLRGSIDLVERRADGTLRATDHKTGRERMSPGGVVAGGHSLQPVLYALAAEKLFPDARALAGRLYYCTAAGGFAEVSVPLDEVARRSAEQVARTIGAALAHPFFPAAPAEGACRWCDYAEVCGPYEEIRTRRKSQVELQDLARLREMP